ncbi:hypothetical protein GCM10009779_25760 [Polymorphospora rubra]|uniref:Uncharacterized protein n=1 Tax=Polymorphospora rubra TaxID=338584 RepID=A0A810N0A8_9ACTN|nr:hypothetical protein Prubr_38530 [Polymorphospora rubra]
MRAEELFLHLPAQVLGGTGVQFGKRLAPPQSHRRIEQFDAPAMVAPDGGVPAVRHHPPELVIIDNRRIDVQTVGAEAVHRDEAVGQADDPQCAPQPAGKRVEGCPASIRQPITP